MNVRLLGLFMAFGLSIPVVAQAQMLQPGLWELTSSNMQVDGNQLPDFQMMVGQIKTMLTPVQLAQLEKQGINIGGKGVRVCLTPQQVKSDSIPLTDPQSGCKQQITERSGNQWKFRFSCPKAQGTGTATFASDREFTTHVTGTFNATGLKQTGSMDSEAVWLGTDCGAVKPRA
ncbi:MULTISPECIES: DUF3617 domain-containing protein [unclassified Pseudomonas]|uniref:DUF3617 domain-containing protein n=1 Tax=unclassified Pseudomonas TaxID=196821 RepID=UPI001472D1A0|nr:MULTISPECIES: DUF3617 domain-containing protein [unclassified Pseudomonas]NMY36005.1 DUF3617 domain-containing protein [Pseudomonas sp. WS 5078]NMY58746.1 DUF3617 domain-containing protein [Pseudomonas sp. WS 5354]